MSGLFFSQKLSIFRDETKKMLFLKIFQEKTEKRWKIMNPLKKLITDPINWIF